MPATSTAINGCDAVILLDDNLGTPQDISGSSNSFELNFEVEIGDFKPFGSDFPIRLGCGRDAALSLEIVYTMAANEARDLFNDWFFNNHATPRTVTIQLPDATPGGDQYSGEFILESYSFSAEAGEAGPIMASISLLPDDAVAYSVIV